MSETKNNNTKEERKPYVVEVDPIPFEEDYKGKYMTSVRLCKLCNDIYKSAFDDYVGCTFEVTSGIPLMSMYFTHARQNDKGVYCCERSDGKTTGVPLLDRTRIRDFRMREGDRYKITEDGKDVITKLLHPRFYNGGKPNWGTIVTEILDKSMANAYNPSAAQQLTKISGIDPKQIIAAVTKDAHGSDIQIEVKGTLNPTPMFNQQNPTYILNVMLADAKNLQKTYEELGIGSLGSNIIR